MKRFRFLSLLLLPCCLWASALTASAQDETGGSGTIDPNSVAIHQPIYDNTLLDDPENETLQPARNLATDAAGNLYTLVAINRNYYYTSYRTFLSKYSPDGTLIWRRERQVASNGSETFSPTQTPVPTSGAYDYQATVLPGVLRVDPAGNVTVGFNSALLATNQRSNKPEYNAAPFNLIVRFDTDGNFVWRAPLTAETLGAENFPYAYYGGQYSAPGDYSGIDLQVTADGGVVAVIGDGQRPASGQLYHVATVVVRLAPNGTRLFAKAYGTSGDGTNATPLALAADGNRGTYVVTQENPYTDDTYNTAESTNVIRKFDGTGNQVARAATPYFDAANNQANEQWVEAKTDANGVLYVAGAFRRNRTSVDSGDGQAGQLLRAYNSDLSLRWRVLGPQPTQTAQEQPIVQVNGLRLGPTGITVAGITRSDALLGADGDEHWEITRYAYANGALQWHRLYQGTPPANTARSDTVQSFQVDAQDNVYAVGNRSASPVGENILVKYSAVGDTQFIKVLPNDDLGDFQLTDTGLLAYVTTQPSYPAKTVVVQTVDNPAVVAASSHPAFFNGEVALSNGVYYLQFAGTGNPFGYYAYLSDPHYFYHFDLGYEYWFDAADGRSGVYLYDFASSTFFYTSPGFPFPYLYDFSLNTVLYYYPDPNNPGRYNTNGVRYFYNYATGKIITK
ncbi:MAG: hypothetical protein INR62_04575 [Rhodospirillales bacterium]|nr:hypothetical protein [Acetobacter sp.]